MPVGDCICLTALRLWQRNARLSIASMFSAGVEHERGIFQMASVRELKHYYRGEWTGSKSVEYRDVVNPATGEKLARAPIASKEDVNAAVAAAAAAYPAWRRTPPEDRIQYLFKMKQLLEDHVEELAQICTQENGKTVGESRAELRRAIENVEVA